MIRKSRPNLIVLFCFLSLPAFAEDLVIDFSDLSLRSNSDLVWNSEQKRLHPPIKIYDWDEDGIAPFSEKELVLGDGRHGAFVPDRYAYFSQGGDLSGQVIRLDMARFDGHLQVTKLHLAAGWTLQTIDNQPLVISSLGAVDIFGTINCSGEPGEDVNSDITQTVNGGMGRCGGGQGGKGGSDTVPATKGDPGGASVDGGEPGGPGNVDGGNGGGGGGSYPSAVSNLGSNGDDPSGGAGGGQLGASFTDDGFLETGAGSGGGGGSAFTDLGGVPDHSSGAGGGGGGGIVSITAASLVTIHAGGSILAEGGDGGIATGSLKGGGGGGGGGGSIFVASADDVLVDGFVSATQGVGGFSNGGAGGFGADGRSWLVGKFGIAAGAGTVDPDSDLPLPGEVYFDEGQFSALSEVIDLKSSKPLLTGIKSKSELLAGATAEFDLQTSDSSDFSSSCWVKAESLLNQPLKRYLKFRVRVNNVDGTQNSYIEQLTFSYDLYVETDFNFVSGCGRVQNATPPSAGFWWFLFLPLALLLGLRWNHQR